MINIAFLASHNGSAARAIAKACLNGALTATPSLLVSNNPDCKAIEWAKDLKLKTAIINTKNSQDPDSAIAGLFEDNNIDLVVFSGYMKLVGPKTISSVHGALLNTHPALLPKYGGKGMYGRHVHQAVFDNKDSETGITIHLVDGEYDHGRMIAQKRIPVLSKDSVEAIEEKVKAAEPDFYIETLEKILSGEISLA
jgi:phosphoribosylglycinamide formyltransferase 1